MNLDDAVELASDLETTIDDYTSVQSSCSPDEQTIEDRVRECAGVEVPPENMWRNLDGSRAARLVNGKIELTYSVVGCLPAGNSRQGEQPSCEEMKDEISKAIALLNENLGEVSLREVESDANITISYGEILRGYARVDGFNSNEEMLEKKMFEDDENRFEFNDIESRRISKNTLQVNTNECHWTTDSEICRYSTGKKTSSPQFKTLILHEMLHALGFKHSQCDRDISIVGPFGGHGHFELNEYDQTMIKMYYQKIIQSY
jgi:hypothetical protein